MCELSFPQRVLAAAEVLEQLQADSQASSLAYSPQMLRGIFRMMTGAGER